MRVKPSFILALLLLLVASPMAAQTDVIRGRVTGMDGELLAGVRVTATSIPGNVTREAQTNAQGAFQIAFPGGTGDYMMGYALFGYSFRQFQVKRLADEAVLIADARLAPVQLDSIVATAPVQQRVNRNQQAPDVGGTDRPVTASDLTADQQGNIAAMAASLPGVVLLPGLDGEPDAFSVLGLGGDQNSVTLNGMQMGADGLPRDAGFSSSLVTSPFDVSRGGFSGGNFNISSRPGSNFRSRGLSLVLTTPQVQWTDRAAQALGNDYTNASLGGMASGPISLNTAFYNVSFQLGRQLRDNQTLLSTNALGLQTAGVAPDSVNRFVGILQGRGIPVAAGGTRPDRISDNGSFFGSFDFSPPSSSSGQSWGLNVNGNWRRQTPVGGGGALSLPSSEGERSGWNGGVQARHSGYFGMILSESAVGVNLSRDDEEPYLVLPGGRVRVSSDFADGASGLQSLTFGGNQGLGSTSESISTSFQNNLSWFDDANKHRLKLSSELQYSGSTDRQASNQLGTFSFNSLADFEAGRPSSFSRTLSALERATGVVTGSLSLGDSYRPTQDVQLQFGIRVDGSRYTTSPSYNAVVEQVFGRRNDALPSPVAISPRIGFSWTVGQAQEVAAFMGAARSPRAVIRGGIGVFSNNAGAGQLGQVMANTGLPSGIQQIMCIGPAVPVPDWSAYSDPAAVPDRCADGTSGTVFSNSAPNVTLFGSDYAPPKTVRSNLSWTGGLLNGRFSGSVEGTYAWNLGQQRFVDLNFDPTQRFTLGDDGRPVYVQPSSIVPATGAIASRDARVSQAFARVTELRSDLESRTAQLSLRVSPIPRGPTNFGWSAAYTFTDVQEQVSGFNSTAGDPLRVEWGRSGQGPHQISYSLRYRFFNALDVSWNGAFRSGNAYTPLVAGDINGDGYANDRAYVFAPGAAADPALAAGMAELLRTADSGTRECLEQQLGKVAGRNSCRGPWTSSASLNITLDRAKFRMPQRGSVSFSVSNPLGAADLLLNGSGNLKGWGQSPFPDQSLLYVRGFDPATQQYRYEVNPRFGATRPQFVTLRSPVVLTASMRLDLGPTRERQMLSQQLASGRTQPGSRMPETFLRQMAVSAVQNPLSVILRSQDSLQLSSMQADSLASMNRRYTYRSDSLWTPIARELAAMGNEYDDRAAYAMYLDARRLQVDMLTEMVNEVRALLTSEQRRKLPGSVINLLDPRYLALIRDGTGMYVGGSSMFGGGMVVREFSAGMMGMVESVMITVGR